MKRPSKKKILKMKREEETRKNAPHLWEIGASLLCHMYGFGVM